jgi:type IV secretory pathway VirB2 component (pilin)
MYIKSKSVMVATGAALLTAVDAAFSAAFAQGNPFEEGISKGNELIGYLTGDIAKLLILGAIVCIGLLFMAGKLPKEWAVRLGIGSLLLLSATAIADWLFA